MKEWKLIEFVPGIKSEVILDKILDSPSKSPCVYLIIKRRL